MTLPPRLYKYRSVRGEALEHVRRTVASNEVYFADPTSFNDPFECRFTMSVSGTDEQWEQFLARPDLLAAHNVRPETPPPRSRKSEWRSNLENSVGELAERFRERLKRDVGVFCLAERNDNILLWSHYADCHRGICLGFAPTRDPLLAGEIEKVVYQEEFPVLKYLDRQDEHWPKVTMATKSTNWLYEAEWRVIRIQGAAGVHTLAPGTVTDIILGAEIAPGDEASVMTIAASATEPLAVWRAVRSPDAYAIRVQRES